MKHATILLRFRALLLVSVALIGCSDLEPSRASGPTAPTVIASDLDAELRGYLASHGFTGRIASTLEARLGRRINHQLADVGRLLWFDPIQGLNNDNTCGGCHSPTHGFGDTQPIAIGIDNNGIVGPGRTGPRNQRRSLMVINTAFYPTLMWNSRFHAPSGDPFDNSMGFVFPLRKAPHSRTCRICSRRRRSFRRPRESNRPDSISPVTTMTFARKSCDA